MTTSSRSTSPKPNQQLSRRLWWSVLPAALVALWNLASAPFLSELLVKPFRLAVGDQRSVVLLGSFTVFVGVAVVIAGWRHLGEDRPRRMALIALGIALVAGYVLVSQRGKSYEAAVERLHFVSYGSLAALLVVPLRRLRLLLTVAGLAVVMVVALLDEGLQWWVPVRTGEFFDVGLNLYAGVCGLLIGLGLFAIGVFSGDGLRIGWKPECSAVTPPWPETSAAGRMLAPLLIVVTLLMAGFVQVVHLGVLVDDPDVGRFRSFFSQQQLKARNQAAIERWTVEPPGPLTPFEKEDWYRTEAGWHVLARNRANAAENWRVAWGENSLLEKYYGGFLATRGRGGGLHRLEPQHVAELERLSAALGTAATPFQSHADRGRIWVRPTPPVLWSVALALISVLGWWWRSARS